MTSEQPQDKSPVGSQAIDLFIGRQSELERLEAALSGTLAGDGRVALVSGEPGIGKTILCNKVARVAQARGFAVLTTTGYEHPGAPLWWPWIQALGKYVADAEPKRLAAELGSQGDVLSELLPDLRDRIPDLTAPTPIQDPDSARFRVLDAVATFVKRAARSQPLLIVLDDLHWADEPSLQLLEFLARGAADSRLMLIGIYPDVELARDHPLPRALAELTRVPMTERLRLRGFTRGEVRQVIERLAGSQIVPWFVDQVYERTDGNPLFVCEVTRLLLEDGQLRQIRIPAAQQSAPYAVSLPGGAREVIGRRLDRLTDGAIELLRLAAVVGRSFSVAQLTAASTGASEDEMLSLLDEGLSAHVIEEAEAAPDQYRFSHSLVRESLLETLSASRRVRMHARIAEALERIYGTENDQHIEELAYHFSEAEPFLGADRSNYYRVRAGAQALAHHSLLRALSHFDRIPASPPDQPLDWTIGHSFSLGTKLDSAITHLKERGLVTTGTEFEVLGWRFWSR